MEGLFCKSKEMKLKDHQHPSFAPRFIYLQDTACTVKDGGGRDLKLEGIMKRITTFTLQSWYTNISPILIPSSMGTMSITGVVGDPCFQTMKRFTTSKERNKELAGKLTPEAPKGLGI